MDKTTDIVQHGERERHEKAQCRRLPVSGHGKHHKKCRLYQKIHEESERHRSRSASYFEACLSGYAGVDFPTFEGYDWDLLRVETDQLRVLAQDLEIWLILGSSHFRDGKYQADKLPVHHQQPGRGKRQIRQVHV